MAVRQVLRMGHPTLMRVADPVSELDTAALHALVADLWETMAAYGGVGLAAPQIGEPVRVVVFGMDASERYPEAPPVPRTVLVNPEIEPIGDERVDGWEGCLSVPGLRGVVPRWRRIVYRGRDAAGRPVEREAEDFHARVVQHECDHLDGVLYPMRMTDLGTLGFEPELLEAGRLTPAECDD